MNQIRPRLSAHRATIGDMGNDMVVTRGATLALLASQMASEAQIKSPLTSVYDYLYRVGGETPGYSLYSYALFPTYSPRAEHFLERLFKTTGHAEKSKIDIGSLNVIYIPIREYKVFRLRQNSDNLIVPADQFAKDIYDYALARKIISQICAEPAEEIRDVCATDLSRGPYLFTYSQPVSKLSTIPPPYLFLDLSYVHERAFGRAVQF